MKKLLAVILMSMMMVFMCTGCALSPFAGANGGTQETEETDKDSAASNTVQISENQIRQDLGIPSGERVNIVYGETYYWSGGDKNLVPVSIYMNGDYMAGADYDIESREPVRNICGWDDGSSTQNNTQTSSNSTNNVIVHHYYYDGNYYEGSWNEYVIPDSDSRVISESELYGLSKGELRIARNEIYARHGRLFNDNELQSYFNTCSWYYGYISPDSFSDSMLNSVETKNKDTIVNYETRMGYKK